jgi:cell division protein DivIC
VTIRKKQNKLDQRTKIIMIIVLIFVVILAFSYINLRQKSKKIAKEQQQVESQIKKQEEKKKELKKKKEYIKTKEFIEKTATEKFGLLYPGEYLLKDNLRIFIVNKRECCIRATFLLSFLYRMMRRGTIYVKRDIKTGKRRLSKSYV